ncbi:hypothetical protein CBL_12117 [Carabus blaptoides fortunei]
MEVYVGTQPEGPFRKSNKSQDIVESLIQPVSGTKRNITFDNWFTSYALMINLLQRHRLTSVGTLGKNKRQMPSAFLFAFKEDITATPKYTWSTATRQLGDISCPDPRENALHAPTFPPNARPYETPPLLAEALSLFYYGQQVDVISVVVIRAFCKQYIDCYVFHSLLGQSTPNK